MSNAALNWAFTAKVSRSCDKFLLVALANYADDEGVCFPSQSRLVEDTALDRKTVIAGVRRLVETGLLLDTGNRVGATRQIAVYRLNFEPETPPSTVPNKEPLNAPTNGTVETNGMVPYFPPKGPVFPMEGSRISAKGSQIRDTEPLEPSRNHQRNPQPPKVPHAEPAADAEPVCARGPPSPGAFDAWWERYPRKEGRGAARAAYAKAVTKAEPAALLAALDRRWPSRKFIPHPATWLNQERWTDELDTHDPVLRAAGLDQAGRLLPEHLPAETPALRIVK